MDIKDIDGTVYTLHLFSYPGIYMGDVPDKHASYIAEIIWRNASGENLLNQLT